jgi:hypothetical protein
MTKSEEQLHLNKYHRSGKNVTVRMNDKFKYSTWTNDANEIHLLGQQAGAILYAFYDLPTWFKIIDLYTLLGYAHGNNNVKQTIARMLKEGILTMQQDNVGTDKYYLREWAREFLPRIEIPDINETPSLYERSIRLRLNTGRQHLNTRERQPPLGNAQQRKLQQ